MENIRINEYVRLKNGKIGIFKGYNKSSESPFNCKIQFKNTKNPQYYTEECVIDHNEDIKDILKAGDIIEWTADKIGFFGINEVVNRFGKKGVYAEEYDDILFLNEIKILRILTKEQFESNCYSNEN